MYGANRASSNSENVTTTIVVLSELGAAFFELCCIRTTPEYELVTFTLVRCDITNSIVSTLYCYNDKTRENKHLILVVGEIVRERGRHSLDLKTDGKNI